jgi:quercetin dioxygenase-like cupin family protein
LASVSVFGELASVVPVQFRPGMLARALSGEGMTLSVIEIAPDTFVPEHSQEHEALAMLVRGSATLHVGPKSYLLRPGSIWRLQGHVEHSLQVGQEGAVLVASFAPRRDDWDQLGRVEVSPPVWPDGS